MRANQREQRHRRVLERKEARFPVFDRIREIGEGGVCHWAEPDKQDQSDEKLDVHRDNKDNSEEPKFPAWLLATPAGECDENGGERGAEYKPAQESVKRE